MKRDNLDFLEAEQIDKVMALYGKAMTKKENEIESLKDTNKELTEKIGTYETKINEFNESSKDNADWKNKYEELQTSIKEQEAKNEAEKQDEILTNNILNAFGDKKFTSEYAKKGLLSDVKGELNKPENKGKGINDIITDLTKDKDDIFVNPNQLQNDMTGMGDSEDEKPKETPILW